MPSKMAGAGELFAGTVLDKEAWLSGEEMSERARREIEVDLELLVGEEAEQLIFTMAAERPEILLKLKSRLS